MAEIRYSNKTATPAPTWTGGSLDRSEIAEKVTQKTVDWAEKFGRFLAEKPQAMTTSQLRRFYGEVKRQQTNRWNPTDFAMLKPKLAYAVGRDKGTKIRAFYDEMAKLFPSVTNADQFDNFVRVFEAIVAFHKASSKE